MNTNEMFKVFETLLAVPGMNDAVRVDIKLSRKEILLLSQAIKEGSQQKDGIMAAFLKAFPKEQGAALDDIAGEFLSKAGLSELYQKIVSF